MERDLESMQDAVKHPNQTVRAFLLPLMQYVVSRFHNEKQRLVGSLILAVFLLWQLLIDPVDDSIS